MKKRYKTLKNRWSLPAVPSSEDNYIYKEEIKELLDSFNDRCEILRLIVGQTHFDIWAARYAYGGSIRELAINFHMSRFNIRKHLKIAAKRINKILRVTCSSSSSLPFHNRIPPTAP